MNQNLLFVVFIVLIISFVVRKSVYLAAIFLAIVIVYCWFISRFANPREFINYIKGSTIELFNPCSVSNPAYCNDRDSNWTFLPDILKSKSTNNIEASNTFNASLNIKSNIGASQISIEDILNAIPILQEFKIYLDKTVKIIRNIITDDTIQRKFLANKLQYKMVKLFYCANETLSNITLPEHNYNELLLAQREFDDTLNIITFITLDERVIYDLAQLHKEFAQLCFKLDKYIIDKVNSIKPEEYNILSGRLPTLGEPIAANQLDFDIFIKR